MKRKPIRMMITFRVYTKDGKLKSKKTFQAKSWIRPWFWFWTVATDTFNRTPPANFFVDGSSGNFSPGTKNYSFDETPIEDFGIIVGTSSQALDAEDNKLISRINNGSLSGEMIYSSMVITDPTSISGVISQKSNRSLTNNSGGSITVREVGLYAAPDAASRQALMERSLKTQIVLNSEILNVEYDFTETI